MTSCLRVWGFFSFTLSWIRYGRACIWAGFFPCLGVILGLNPPPGDYCFFGNLFVIYPSKWNWWSPIELGIFLIIGLCFFFCVWLRFGPIWRACLLWSSLQPRLSFLSLIRCRVFYGDCCVVCVGRSSMDFVWTISVSVMGMLFISCSVCLFRLLSGWDAMAWWYS